MSSEERSAAVLLLAVTALVPALWWVLGWRPDLLVGANDLSLLLLPAMRRLLAVHGDFDAFVYDPAWLGGSKLRDILGALPLHRLLAQLPIDAVALLNASAMFAQVLYGYLGARSARAVACLLKPGLEVGLPAQLAVAMCSAFSPLIGWRLAYGHLFILFGALALPAACALVLLARARQLSFVCVTVAGLALLHALPHVGLQPVLYGAVFGAPLLLAYLCFEAAGERGLRALAPAIAAGLGAAFCSLPVLHGLIAQFSGGDLPRGFGARPVTYSYLVATGRDWLQSLLWHMPGASSGRAQFEWHETNYPIGPALLFLSLLPRRAWLLALGVLTSVGLVLAFSTDLRPISSWLLAALPPLAMFRVPARAALPLVLAFAPLLLGLAISALPAPRRRDGTLILAALVAAWLPGFARELALWALVALAIVLARRARAYAFSAPALLATLALYAVLGFQQRLLPFPSRSRLSEEPAAAGAALRARFPELDSSLVRAASTPELQPNNTLYQMGVSSLSGYNLLNQRFVRLYCALLGEPYQPHVSLVSIDPSAAYFPKLAALYDITVGLDLRARPPRAARLPASGRPLWFGERLRAQAGYRQLVAGLDPDDLHRSVPFVASDVAARGLPELSCEAPTGDMSYALGSGPTLLRVRLAAPRSGTCPFVVSMNYVGELVATGRGPGAEERLRTFPAYGALLGVVVPAEVTALEIALPPSSPWWTYAAAALGVFLLLGLLLWSRHASIPPPA